MARWYDVWINRNRYPPSKDYGKISSFEIVDKIKNRVVWRYPRGLDDVRFVLSWPLLREARAMVLSAIEKEKNE